MKKVVIIGPESTGKSTLSAALAEHFNTVWVPEYARQYINQLKRPYDKADLLEIAKGQIKLEKKLSNKADKLLICDTDLLVIKIWSEHKYGICDQKILEMIKQQSCDLYLLTDIDFPWEEDPQRENPHLREYFMQVFEEEINANNVPYIKISGDRTTRLKSAVEAINRLFRLQ